MKCPGQDRRYWKGDVAFEVPCPQCGATVELFRDESAGRCPHCSHRFPNPGANFGCARWCSLASECLGYSPQPQAAAAERPLAARVIQALEEVFRHDPNEVLRALKVFQYAKELAAEEGGDPRIVLAAALLHATSSAPGGGTAACVERRADIAATAASTTEILQRIGLCAEVSARVCTIVDALRTGAAADREDADTVESKIVSDAVRLVELSTRPPDAPPNAAARERLVASLRTAAGKQKAMSLLSSQGTTTP
jgi:hypothetical protein